MVLLPVFSIFIVVLTYVLFLRPLGSSAPSKAFLADAADQHDVPSAPDSPTDDTEEPGPLTSSPKEPPEQDDSALPEPDGVFGVCL